MKLDKPQKATQLDERNHVEKPLLDQLASLGWHILDLEKQLQTLNPWLQSDQTEEVITNLTASFPSTTKTTPANQRRRQRTHLRTKLITLLVSGTSSKFKFQPLNKLSSGVRKMVRCLNKPSNRQLTRYDFSGSLFSRLPCTHKSKLAPFPPFRPPKSPNSGGL
jgi:hypothetical protein